MGVVKGQDHTISPVSNSFAFFLFHINQIFMRYSYFEIWPWKINGQGHGWDQSHIIHTISKRCTSFSFHINRNNHSWDMSNRVFYLAKYRWNFQKEIWQKKKVSKKSHQVISMTRGISLPGFVVIGWVVLTLSCRQANFCFNATAVTLGQGHRKVIQYIFPDLYFLCPKYLSFSPNGFWRDKQKSLRRRRQRTEKH